MQTESIELSFLSIFAFITFFVFLIVSKYFNSSNNNTLLDTDFLKPQAFHNEAIPRSGGLASIISLFVFFGIYYLLFSKILYDYIFLCTSLFFLGYLDDMKIKINPKQRLFLMTLFLTVLINFLQIEIKHMDLIFLNSWLENNFFSTIFILLCFLFIINGANLVDGFNGLLVINLIIINSLLLAINLKNNQIEFSFLITAQIIILISFLLFNFPKAKMFFGDSGSYLFGSLTVMNIIETNNKNPEISSFFFCVILFYLFFEVFFSFFRKLLLKKSPLKPDDKHLHMLFYKYLERSGKFIDSNYITSLFINLIYAFFTLPIIFFKNNGIVCRYWFFSLLILYIIFYLRIYSFTKK